MSSVVNRANWFHANHDFTNHFETSKVLIELIKEIIQKVVGCKKWHPGSVLLINGMILTIINCVINSNNKEDLINHLKNKIPKNFTNDVMNELIEMKNNNQKCKIDDIHYIIIRAIIKEIIVMVTDYIKKELQLQENEQFPYVLPWDVLLAVSIKDDVAKFFNIPLFKSMLPITIINVTDLNIARAFQEAEQKKAIFFLFSIQKNH